MNGTIPLCFVSFFLHARLEVQEAILMVRTYPGRGLRNLTGFGRILDCTDERLRVGDKNTITRLLCEPQKPGLRVLKAGTRPTPWPVISLPNLGAPRRMTQKLRHCSGVKTECISHHHSFFPNIRQSFCIHSPPCCCIFPFN
jgi:hypothetical protein